MAKKRLRTRKERVVKEPLVNGFAARHGDYREATVVDLNNELGGGRQKTYSVLRNMSATVVDGWLADPRSGFEEPQCRAIGWVRNLWVRADGSAAVSRWGSMTGCATDEGASQSVALGELALLKKKFPRRQWDTFEMACRWDEVPGDEESALHQYTKNCVGFVSSMIAMWRGY